jgi:hypothetical protein
MTALDGDFAPADPSDGRQPGDWKSRYADASARRAILGESCYLGILFVSAPIVALILWLEYPKYWLHLSDAKYRTLFRYAIAWVSGTLGGTLFDIKWLYHSVAKYKWNLDRRLWRVFTPHISGALSCAVVALISSGILRVFDHQATESPSLVFALAFLVGYFSDNTIAKLAEVAGTLFGPIRPAENGKEAAAPKAT